MLLEIVFTDIIHYLILILGGMFSGFVNVLAGAGSLMVLPILAGIGLPMNIANGTNRIAILMQDIAGVFKFFKSNKLPLKICLILSIPTAIGAGIGALLVSGLSDKILNTIVMIVLLLMLLYIIFKGVGDKNEQHQNTSTAGYKTKVDILTFIIFLIIGAYAGFIQGGATLLWFAVLTWRMKFDMITADAIKLFMNFVMTPIALVIFMIHKQVSYLDGLILGIGSFAGAWIGAQIVMKIKPHFIKIFMIVVLSVASAYMFFFKII